MRRDLDRRGWGDSLVAQDVLPLLNDLHAAMQHEKHRGMY